MADKDKNPYGPMNALKKASSIGPSQEDRFAPPPQQPFNINTSSAADLTQHLGSDTPLGDLVSLATGHAPSLAWLGNTIRNMGGNETLANLVDLGSQFAPTQAVTRYMMRTPEGNVPSAALRKEGNEKASRYAGYLGSNYKEAYDWFASRWPRVAAHMDIQPTLDRNDEFLAAARPHVNSHAEEQTIPLHFSDLTQLMGPTELKPIMAHEGTHIAQTLGNKDFPRMYHNNEVAFGYNQNPYELSANRREFTTEFARKSRATDKEAQELNRFMTRKPKTQENLNDIRELHNRSSKRMAPAGGGNANKGTERFSAHILEQADKALDTMGGLTPAQAFSPAYRQRLAGAVDNLDIIDRRAAHPMAPSHKEGK